MTSYRYFTDGDATSATILEAVFRYARTSEDEFLISPVDVRSVTQSGLVLSGEVSTIHEVLTRYPGVSDFKEST